jgi:putative phage-type endonuclease
MTTTGTRVAAVELLPAGQAGPHNPAWHDMRRHTDAGWSVTASEIAAVLGISPWDTPFSLYWRKRQGWETEDDEAKAIGRILENGVISLCAGRHPDAELIRSGLYAHPARLWQMATPDAICYARDTWTFVEVVDAKTAERRTEPWGEDGTDDIPAYYRAQLLWQMDVLGVARGRLGVLFLQNRQYREYIVDYDARDVAVMHAAAARFRADLDTETPPPVDGHPATTETLRRLHPSVVDEAVEIPAQLAEAYRRVKALSRRIAAAEARVCNRVRDALGPFRVATHDGREIAKRSVYDQTRMSIKTLRAERPEIYAAYATKSTTDKLLPGRDLNR